MPPARPPPAPTARRPPTRTMGQCSYRPALSHRSVRRKEKLMRICFTPYALLRHTQRRPRSADAAQEFPRHSGSRSVTKARDSTFVLACMRPASGPLRISAQSKATRHGVVVSPKSGHAGSPWNGVVSPSSGRDQQTRAAGPSARRPRKPSRQSEHLGMTTERRPRDGHRSRAAGPSRSTKARRPDATSREAGPSAGGDHERATTPKVRERPTADRTYVHETAREAGQAHRAPSTEHTYRCGERGAYRAGRRRSADGWLSEGGV